MKNNLVENLVLIYSVDGDKLKIFLYKKADDPYKGYWFLPSEVLNNETTIEESTKNIYNKLTNLNCDKFCQSYVFSDLDRGLDDRVIGITSVVITDKTLASMNKEDNLEWFDVDELPKIGLDHKEIIQKVSHQIKYKIACNYDDILLDLFPSDFTLTELQNFYENMTSKFIDKRNFRKKLTNQNLVVDTGEKILNGGRPATLYRFNKEKMEGNLL